MDRIIAHVRSRVGKDMLNRYVSKINTNTDRSKTLWLTNTVTEHVTGTGDKLAADNTVSKTVAF